MKNITIARGLPALLVLMMVALLMPVRGTSYSQSSETMLPDMVTYYSVKEFGAQISELKSEISLHLADIPIVQALFSIAEKADLEIAFNPEIFTDKQRVTINNEKISVADALQFVMNGTGYETVITSHKQLILKKTEPRPEEAIQTTVTGRVTDADTGEPLMGVTVFVEGTQRGTSTDVDGTFTLLVPEGSDFLTISYVGYVQQQIAIAGQAEFNIALSSDVALLDDVVVIGYGTQQRTEVTGSVVSIRAEAIQNAPVASFENALQGRLAGVNVAESSGEPGAAPQITIRGTGSISAGNEPLYVIDGVPISQNFGQQDAIQSQAATYPDSRSNPLAALNPNDIESIEVLKDASAAAIYGSRGSNGVILITTKTGRKNSPAQVNVRSFVGVQSVFNKPDMMGAADLIDYTKEARNTTYVRELDVLNPESSYYNPNYSPDTNAGRPAEGQPGYSEMYLIPELYVNWDGTDTNWLNLVLDTAVLQNYDMSVSGGAENFTYFFGGGFMDQSGIIEGSAFNRYSIKANLTGDISDHFLVGLQMNGAFTRNDRKAANAPYFANPPGIIYSAMTQSPVVSPYNGDGTYRQLEGSHNELGGSMTTTNHPLAVRDYIDDKLNNNRVFGNIYGVYSFLENLRLKSMLGYDVDNLQRSFYQGTQLYYRGGDPRPYAQSSSAQSFNWVWENTLNYNTHFGEAHRLDAILGYTAQKQRDERNRVVAQNFPDDQVKTIDGGQVTSGAQVIEEWSLVSALARLNYVLLDRYMITATIRSDRSSRFGADHQTGVFPSFSFGWQMVNEPFMANITAFNQLKPRISYGVTGNFLIPNYGSIGLITGSNYVFGDQIAAGVRPATLGNNELTWETTRQVNYGIDYALLQDRVYGSIDYYTSKTTDLLLEVNIPSVTGFTNALTNIGEVSNKGFEFQITSRNIVGNFNWSTDINFAKNRNEVLKLGPEGDPILVPGAAGVRHITMIGEEIGSYYGHEVVGIFQNQAEIDAAPVDMMGNPEPGDFQFRDVNGDGVIDNNDRTILGSYHPDFTWGITNRFNWKNIDFSFFFQGVEGREVLNLTTRHMRNGEANFGSYAVLNNRWRSESNPGDGVTPRADRTSTGNNNRPSSYQVEDGSYIKLKNITFGYNLPQSLASKFATNVRLYGSLTNVAIWTDYIGFNPEVNLTPGSGLTAGEDYGAYPLSRAFQVGIDITF